MDELQIDLPKNLETMQLPDPAYVNYWRLAEKRIFYIEDEIDESILELQKSIININIADMGIAPENRAPITILINSPGGLLSETFLVIDTLLGSKTPIITVNIGYAYSGGALLLLAGHKRYSLAHAKFMLHSGSSQQSGTYEQCVEQQKLYQKQMDEMAEYIRSRTAIDEKTFKQNRNKDWYMDTSEQISYGVVDSVITNFEDIR